jgi:hypothetical protein
MRRTRLTERQWNAPGELPAESSIHGNLGTRHEARLIRGTESDHVNNCPGRGNAVQWLHIETFPFDIVSCEREWTR